MKSHLTEARFFTARDRPVPLVSGTAFLAAVLAGALLFLSGCGAGSDAGEQAAEKQDTTASRPQTPRGAEEGLSRGLTQIDERMAAVDSLFQPLPLLRPAQGAALRQVPYREQLARSRELGVGRALSADRIRTLRRQGRLVLLEDTTGWIVRELNYSEPLVVPALRAALTEIGRRFHARLRDLGAPPFRMEVSSALRTAADQRALRRVNPNAASGESTHEYGTSVDLAYSAFAAPAEPIVMPEAEKTAGAEGAQWARPYLRRYQDVAAGRVAARRALELKALLGEVLLEVQREGLVMVTMERRQPVFHLTLARDSLARAGSAPDSASGSTSGAGP
jgi:hypothetical protein